MQIVLPGINGSGGLWLDIMKIICGKMPDHPASNMCDLMCHRAPYTPQLGFKERKYIDVQNRGFDFPEEMRFFEQIDVLEFLKSCTVDYDVMICSDGIEHLTFYQGCEMLALMRMHSSIQIIFTPLGDYMISEEGHPDNHRCGWTPELLPNYLSVVLPYFHPTLNVGAFFAVDCSEVEKQRIFNAIKSKYVKD